MSEILTVREVAEYLKLTERTVWRRVVDGTFPAIKIGGAVRFSRDDIDAALARARIPVRAA